MFFFSLSLSCSRSFSQIHHNFGIHTRNWNTRCAQLHALNFWWVHRFVYFKLYTVYTCVCMFVCVCVCNVWCGRNGSSINQSSNFSPYTFIWYTYRIRLCNELSSCGEKVSNKTIHSILDLNFLTFCRSLFLSVCKSVLSFSIYRIWMRQILSVLIV